MCTNKEIGEWKMCECPFCTYVPVEEGVLPLPVRIPIHPHPEHWAVWGWLTFNDGANRMGIDIVSGDTTRHYSDRIVMVQSLTSLFPGDAQMTRQNVEQSAHNISVRLSESRYALLSPLTSSFVQIGVATEMPPSIARIQCMRGAPRSVNTATTSGKRASKRPRKAKPTPASPPRSPMRTGGGDSYDITKIGGDAYEMQQIAINCPTWNDETVLYVIEHGGRPPLVDISGRTNLDMFCTFRAPNGDTVRNVRVPRSIVAVLYGRE